MLRLLVALALTIALGLLSRLHPIGWPLYDKSLGDVLYAVAAYLSLALLLRRRSPALVALLAAGWCVTVEVFKLSGIPAQYACAPPTRSVTQSHPEDDVVGETRQSLNAPKRGTAVA